VMRVGSKPCGKYEVHRIYAGYFTSDNEPGGIENATHNTLPKLTFYNIVVF
jgi:hypothetical protein